MKIEDFGSFKDDLDKFVESYDLTVDSYLSGAYEENGEITRVTIRFKKVLEEENHE